MLAHLLRACLVTVLGGLLIAVIEWGSRESLEGQARIVDGDTLVLDGRTLRLVGIDAPEASQSCQRSGAAWACGEEATAALRRLVARQAVRCVGRQHDKYDRLLVTCMVGQGVGEDVGARLVADGLAVAYGGYEEEEAEARAAARGLWAGTFERPAAYRERVEKELAQATKAKDESAVRKARRTP